MKPAKPLEGARPPSGPAPLNVKGALKLPEVQELWFALQRRPWLSLVVAPAHAGGSAKELARALCDVGSALRGSPVRFFNAEGSDSAEVVRLIVEVRLYTRNEEMAVIALDPVVTNPTGISVARASDAALLAIEMGRSDLVSARRTIELIGADRMLGSVTLSS